MAGVDSGSSEHLAATSDTQAAVEMEVESVEEIVTEGNWESLDGEPVGGTPVAVPETVKPVEAPVSPRMSQQLGMAAEAGASSSE